MLFDDDDELGELVAQVFNTGRVGRLAALGKRRRAAAAAAIMDFHRQGPQGKKIKGTPFSWPEHVSRLNEKQFKRRYRLSCASFKKLLVLLNDDLKVVNVQQATAGANGCPAPNAVKLAICLRYLAGGDPLDLFLIYHVSLGYVYTCIWKVVDAINRRLHIKFPIDEPAKLAILEAEFRAASIGGIWEGQVGALDGVHFATVAPKWSPYRGRRREGQTYCAASGKCGGKAPLNHPAIVCVCVRGARPPCDRAPCSAPRHELLESRRVASARVRA